MKKNLLYVIGFFVVMTVGIGLFNIPETKKAPSGETYTVVTKKTDDVALSDFMQQYREGIFETVRLVDNNKLEGLIVLSQKTGTSAGTSVILSKEYNKLITDIPFETKFTDLGIVTSGSTTVEVDNNTQNPYVSFAVENILPIVLFVLVLMFIMKQIGGKGGMGGLPIKFSVGRQKDPNDGSKKTTFADVAGMEEVKNEVQEIVDFLKTPEKYIKVGARIPKGVLLYGQPGTGKTLLARAVAGEAGVPFISASGSEFMEMLVGMGAAKVRELFTKAKAQAPAIIFIDEIDAIGKRRGGGMTGGHQEQEQTLNQILTEMDGFEQDTKIIVMASTNRPDTLDPALMRSGRFDRKVLVTLPTVEERTQIINYYLKDKKVAEDINIESLARRMSGFAGADIETIINEAALKQAKEDREMLTRSDLDYGLEKVVMGPEKKSRRLSEHEREIVIYHELGHAVTAYNLKNCDPVEKISIVSRGQALGVTWMMPDEDKNLYSKQKFLDECVSLLGGRAAEEIFFGVDNITTGASNDLERVTAHLSRMLTKYGMDEELGTLVYETDENSLTKPYSEQTAQMIDMKLRSLVHELYSQSKKLIADNKELMIILGKILDKREYIHKEEFSELMAAGEKLEEVAERIKGSNL